MSEPKPAVIPHAEEIAVTSREGLDYRIFIYSPKAPPPPGGYPVIYVLDGNAWFEPVAHAVRLQSVMPAVSGVVPAVVVGIGYPSDVPFNQLRRFYDYVPDVPLKEKVPEGVTPPEMGGADQFLQFIQEELEPEIESRVAIDRRRRTLFGHSLGCSFTLHVLFTETDAFPNYVCSSPSLGFNGAYILDEEKSFTAGLEDNPVDARLMFAVAEYEEKMPPHVQPEFEQNIRQQLERARVVSGGKELHKRLSALSDSGLDTTFVEIMNEHHISMVPVLINRMLPYVLRPTAEDLAAGKR